MPAALTRRKKEKKTEGYTLTENLHRRGKRIFAVQNFCGSRLAQSGGDFLYRFYPLRVSSEVSERVLFRQLQAGTCKIAVFT
jgi:hypothetical protein